jgi:hypothetical protein
MQKRLNMLALNASNQHPRQPIPMPDTATPSLLPCPFCGSRVKLEHVSGSYGYTYDRVQIECKACAGSAGKVAFSQKTEDWAPGKGTFSIRAQATDTVVARWNRRAV